MHRFVFALAVVVFALAGAAVAAEAPPQLPPGMTKAQFDMMMKPGPAHPAGLPANVEPMFGCVPTMGYHYVSPKNWPFGPIYGWYNGKPIFTEIMVDEKLFQSGKSWDDQLKPLPGYKIDHVDLWYEAHGHPGYDVPHYDIHAWYIPRSQYMKFCNNPSGKKPSWL